MFALGGARIPALAPYAVELPRRTALEAEGVRVSTTEHLLAALMWCGIGSALVEVDGPEIPIMDGSAAPFVQGLYAAGLQPVPGVWDPVVVTQPVWASEGGAMVAAVPNTNGAGRDGSLEVLFSPNSTHPVLGGQTECLAVTRGAFAVEIAPARTWCLQAEVDSLLASGLAKGGSLDNALVVGEDGYSSPLRVPREPVKHKILDLLGDLALLGSGLVARVIAVGSGHRLNIRLVRALYNAYLASRA